MPRTAIRSPTATSAMVAALFWPQLAVKSWGVGGDVDGDVDWLRVGPATINGHGDGVGGVAGIDGRDAAHSTERRWAAAPAAGAGHTAPVTGPKQRAPGPRRRPPPRRRGINRFIECLRRRISALEGLGLVVGTGKQSSKTAQIESITTPGNGQRAPKHTRADARTTARG